MPQPQTVKVQLHPAQAAFRRSTALYRGFGGGRGAGKTWVGAYDLIRRAKPKRTYAVYAPTFGMLLDTSYRSFMDIGEWLRFVRSENKSRLVVELGNGARVMFRSLDNPDRARGPNLSGAWMDEASQIERAAYDIIIASLREAGEQGWLSATFTPKGKAHWTYEVFGMGAPDTVMIHSPTYANTFLPDGFYEAVKRQYPSYFAEQELEGRFIDPVGGIFRREWFRVEERAPEGLHWMRYWDLAASTKTTADYTASIAAAMGQDGTIYLRDMIHGRWEWPDQERIMVQTITLNPHEVQGIEKALHGIAAIQSLLRRADLAGVPIRGIDVDKDKITRALPLAARAEQGKVVLVRGAWINDFLDELSAFGGGGSAHDDQVDAASGALQMISEMAALENLAVLI